MRSPRTSEEFVRLVLEAPDWCNIVALTPEQRIVLVRQYRFGSQAVSLEIPGGALEPGEDSGTAARRELLEETGYTATRWTYLGCSEPNPAVHDNLLHHWLAEGARPTHSTHPSGGEDILVEAMTVPEVIEAVRVGDIRNSLGIAGLAHVLDLRTVAPLLEGSS